jgi:molecular chaperone GrpE (heat shock protein)
LLSDEKTVDSIERLENSIKAQTEVLEERTAQSVQQAIIEHSKPLDSTLKDLAQQVSAIREYASCQQERVEKLQDGYDWNIIKTFCLRIIRCIDNLENRIERLSSKGTKTEYLEDIRDEMVFALESSGIEQYQPEINSEYRGQEKYAEAVKQKEHCDNSKQKGKIAEVIRPGYQYIINEENIKIVRTAQVKLFG